MPVPRNVYSLNIKVENAAYNPSLPGNTQVHLHRLHTAAGEAQELTGWFPIKIISTCESVTPCRVLFEVTAGERQSFRFQSSMKHKRKDSSPENPKMVFSPIRANQTSTKDLTLHWS